MQRSARWESPPDITMRRDSSISGRRLSSLYRRTLRLVAVYSTHPVLPHQGRAHGSQRSPAIAGGALCHSRLLCGKSPRGRREACCRSLPTSPGRRAHCRSSAGGSDPVTDRSDPKIAVGTRITSPSIVNDLAQLGGRGSDRRIALGPMIAAAREQVRCLQFGGYFRLL
jgi:hypothetical protein